MKLNRWIVGVFVGACICLFGQYALASGTRTLDGTQITAGSPSNVLTLPQTTDTLMGRNTGDTVTNKTMSGASNTFSNIPVGAVGNGSVLSGNNSGDVTIGTANGLSLVGQALSLGAASSGVTGALLGTDWTTFNSKQAALTFSFPLQNSSNTISLLYDNSTIGVNGPNQIYVKNGGITTTQMSSGAALNGYVATANGSGGVTYSALPVTAPTINGTQASPESVTAAGGITLSTPTYSNVAFVSGSTSGTTTITKTPNITACTTVGQTLVVIAESATNLIKLQDQNTLSGSGLALNGPWTSALNTSISFVCDGNSIWVETARQ